jgi:hypothetical protein
MHAPLKAHFRSQNQLTTVRAELFGSNRCTALGIVAHSAAPVLDLCRKLLVASYDPATPLEAWRGEILCLRVRSIGEGAGLEINAKGTGFVPFRAVRAAPLIAQNCRPMPDATGVMRPLGEPGTVAVAISNSPRKYRSLS